MSWYEPTDETDENVCAMCRHFDHISLDDWYRDSDMLPVCTHYLQETAEDDSCVHFERKGRA